MTLLICRLGASGRGPPGFGRMLQAIACLRAKPTIALPPSQQSWLSTVTTPSNAAVTAARERLGSTASVVWPVWSRATRIGICSRERPRLTALPPRLRAGRGRSERLPLKDSRMKVSYRLRLIGSARRPDRPCGTSAAAALITRIPYDSVFALLDVLLGRTALVVERHHSL